MASTPILNSWTLSTLVGAFLDLGLAYLLLCCSALAFFAAKFLAIFGLSLPCPCNGLFGDPNNFNCLQRLLVDAPTQKIASAHASVRGRFPFNCIWAADDRQFNLKLIEDKPLGDATPLLEFEGEGSCSSNERKRGWLQRAQLAKLGGGVCRNDVKGKRVLGQRPVSSGRFRRRRAFVDKGRVSTWSSSSSHLQLTGDRKWDACEESSVNADSEGDSLPCNGSVEATLPSIESDGQHDEDEASEKDSSFVEELVRNAQGGGLEGNEAYTIRILEQALQEEHAARTALYLELEQERNAAATAADEAMAMILRLQEEKASIEMEARQYHRLIEEKYAYDEEEMNILKEILVRRETEIHFLENEVEAYRQMMLSSETNPQFENGSLDVVHGSGEVLHPFDSGGDPVLMLQQISESIRIRETKNDVNRFSGDGPSAKIQNGPPVLGKEFVSFDRTEDVVCLKQGDVQSIENSERHFLHMPECMDGHNVEFQEKGMVSMDENPSVLQGEATKLEAESPFRELSGSRELRLHERASHLADEEHGPEDNARICHSAAERGDKSNSEMEVRFSKDDGEKDNSSNDSGRRCSGDQTSFSEMESGIHDVHVIDDKSKRCREGSKKESETLLLKNSNNGGFHLDSSGIRTIDVYRGHSSLGSGVAQSNIQRSRSDMTMGLLPLDSSQSVVLSSLRRNSISSVDNERLKLESEVGWLRERLKIVQEGREKLSVTMDHREREKFQLQLLEEIAHQLREIRSLNQPGIATRQASLPPPSSKVNSKKRRCRSVSRGVQEST
eukprot:TRINITY_DN4038_c0_g1_i2.p1 TRINITY_DN4038_c0_g1~~TRINITY_DN4038_c0_g1_i2.p1  ORF type:complete len:786 (+),score=191.54 TRINITY_DN4038_c0_g1_i2:293-2650(+)